MRVLMVTHVGETLGHLVRGLAIADELRASGCEVEIATSPKGDGLLHSWPHPYPMRSVRWEWSHNSADIATPPVHFYARTLETATDVLAAINASEPDLVVGIPGIMSTQAARSLGVRHVSIMHGPYLAPLMDLDRPSDTEVAVIQMAMQGIARTVNVGFSLLSKALALPALTYDEYLLSEPIFVPQPGVEIRQVPNVTVTNFIRASLGPEFDVEGVNLKEACYITFGSGNPCDLTRLVEAASGVFPTVIVTTGRIPHDHLPPGTIARPFIASKSLAGKVGCVVSHGGIGTVGTFAESGCPQLIIPTEMDQAFMAMSASRLGIAAQCGLDCWVRRHSLGREFPAVSDSELVSALHALQSCTRVNLLGPSRGAKEIADLVIADGRCEKEAKFGI